MSEDLHPKTHEDTIRTEMLLRLRQEEATSRADKQRKLEQEISPRAQMQPVANAQNQPIVINNVIQNGVVARRPSLGFVVRALYFLFVGWWFGFVWLGAALAVGVTVIGLPIALLMLSKTLEAFFLW